MKSMLYKGYKFKENETLHGSLLNYAIIVMKYVVYNYGVVTPTPHLDFHTPKGNAKP